MDEEIQTNVRDKLKPYYAMASGGRVFARRSASSQRCSASSKRMGALDQAPDLLGHLIGAALGRNLLPAIFLSLWRDFAARQQDQGCAREEVPPLRFVIKQTLLAFMNGPVAADRAGARGRKDDLRATTGRPSTKSSTRPSQGGAAKSGGAPQAGNRWRPDMAAAQRIDSHPRFVRLFDKGRVLGRALSAPADGVRAHASWRTSSRSEKCFAAPPQYVLKGHPGGAARRSSRRGQRKKASRRSSRWAGVLGNRAWSFTIDRPFRFTPFTELAFGGDGSEPPYSEARRFFARSRMNVLARPC